MSLRTFRSKNFTLRVKRWWLPRERRAARAGLTILEHHAEDHRREVQRRLTHIMLHGHDPDTGATTPTELRRITERGTTESGSQETDN